MIIADTDVVSEFMRDAPDANVRAWAEGMDVEDVTITVLSVQEIELGLTRLPPGRRRADLERRWETQRLGFADTIVVLDVAAARETAQVLAQAAAAGRPMSKADAQIAGMCRAQGHALATRKVRDFEVVQGLTIINPFESL